MPRTPMFNDDQVQKMKDAYVLGRSSLARVAADFGVSVPTIAKYLRKAGVEVRGRGRPRKVSETVNDTPARPDGVEIPMSPEDEAAVGIETPVVEDAPCDNCDDCQCDNEPAVEPEQPLFRFN